jgi:galactokinase
VPPARTALLQSALDALGSPHDDVHAWWVPGRIEFLGKHTDYAGGRSLVCATERGFAVVARPRKDDRIRVLPESNVYIETAARRIKADCHPERREGSAAVFRGVDLAFASDLPPAAGLSSSSALIVATWLALADANGLVLEPREKLASYLGAVENGVGTLGGSQDHAAILCAQPDALVELNFAPPETRVEKTIALPKDHVFVVASSGVAAVKTGNALERYNRAAKRFADRHPARLEQFRAEMEIIPAAIAALERNDLAALGTLVDKSQRNAELLLENQIPETIFLAREARELGAVAASAFGAGFGGSVYALVPQRDAPGFVQNWRQRYAAAFPVRSNSATFFTTRAGEAAGPITH